MNHHPGDTSNPTTGRYPSSIRSHSINRSRRPPSSNPQDLFSQFYLFVPRTKQDLIEHFKNNPTIQWVSKYFGTEHAMLNYQDIHMTNVRIASVSDVERTQQQQSFESIHHNLQSSLSNELAHKEDKKIKAEEYLRSINDDIKGLRKGLQVVEEAQFGPDKRMTENKTLCHHLLVERSLPPPGLQHKHFFGSCLRIGQIDMRHDDVESIANAMFLPDRSTVLELQRYGLCSILFTLKQEQKKFTKNTSLANVLTRYSDEMGIISGDFKNNSKISGNLEKHTVETLMAFVCIYLALLDDDADFAKLNVVFKPSMDDNISCWVPRNAGIIPSTVPF